jgi:2-methylisocitrate lyase-like PEP mutase family enzyme
VLGLPGCPTVAELGALGVRRVSTGGALAKAAYGALVAAARELAGSGTFDYARGGVTAEERAAAFASG